MVVVVVNGYCGSGMDNCSNSGSGRIVNGGGTCVDNCSRSGSGHIGGGSGSILMVWYGQLS